jgi:hypothetical protein
MTSTTTVERTGMAMPGISFPGYGVQTFSTPGFGTSPFTPPGVNYFNVPRCTFKVERVTDGFKVNCVCDDTTSCSVMQNLCTALTGGLCCCCVTYNGMTVCSYNFTMGLCRWEMTDKGLCFYCTSGDPRCSTTLQTWCDCLTSMLNAGCHCCFYVSNTPLCCGCTETSTTRTTGTATPATKR